MTHAGATGGHRCRPAATVLRLISMTAPVHVMTVVVAPAGRCCATLAATTLAGYDISGDAFGRHGSHHVAGDLAGWAGRSIERDGTPGRRTDVLEGDVKGPSSFRRTR